MAVPWTPQESADALALDWQAFRAKYPNRGYDSYETKRRRLKKSTPLEAMLGASTVPPVVVQRASVPKGWEPEVVWNGQGGTITTPALDREPSGWDEILESEGFDPDKFEVVEPVGYRAWDSASGERLKSFRLTIREKSSENGFLDLDALIEEIKTHSLPATSAPHGEDAFVLCIADPQIGSSEGGGSAALVDRFLDSVKASVKQIEALRSQGHPLGTLYLLSLGDLIENCDNFYAQQTFRVDLNRRKQVTLMRRLALETLRILAPLFRRVVVAAVGGNHGENRKNGKSFTDFADNDDVAVWEQVADALAFASDVYGHVNFVIPDSELDITLDIAGLITTITHGHLFSGGGKAMDKAEAWWKGQQHGLRPAGESRLLLSAHFHHLVVKQEGARTHIQAPALVGGSEWFTNLSGLHAPTGMLSFRVTDGVWDDMKVLR